MRFLALLLAITSNLKIKMNSLSALNLKVVISL